MDVVSKLKLVGVLTNAYKFSIVNSIVVAAVISVVGRLSHEDDNEAENENENVAEMQVIVLDAIDNTKHVDCEDDCNDRHDDNKHINLHVLSPSAIDLYADI